MIRARKPHFCLAIISILFVLGLFACGGGSGGGGGWDFGPGGGGKITEVGVFVDSPVAGLKYVSGTVSGVTDQNGTFIFETGQTVRFLVGDILIGETPPQAIITPRDLVAGASIENSIVLNISRFLLSLDNDNNPSNGIVIPLNVENNAIGVTINFTTIDDAALDAMIKQITGKNIVVTKEEAFIHLSSTMLNLLAGTYYGKYTGTNVGTWEVTIEEFGNITGSGFSTTAQVPFDIFGSIGPDGDMTVLATGFAGGAMYEGIINIATGTATGTWKSIDFTESGIFSGNKKLNF